MKDTKTPLPLGSPDTPTLSTEPVALTSFPEPQRFHVHHLRDVIRYLCQLDHEGGLLAAVSPTGEITEPIGYDIFYYFHTELEMELL